MSMVDFEARRRPTVLALTGLDKPTTDALVPLLRATLAQPSYLTQLSLEKTSSGTFRSLGDRRTLWGTEAALTLSLFGALTVEVFYRGNYSSINGAELCPVCGAHEARRCVCGHDEPDAMGSFHVQLVGEDETYSPTLAIEEVFLTRLESLGVDTLTAVLASGELASLIVQLGVILRADA